MYYKAFEACNMNLTLILFKLQNKAPTEKNKMQNNE